MLDLNKTLALLKTKIQIVERNDRLLEAKGLAMDYTMAHVCEEEGTPVKEIPNLTFCMAQPMQKVKCIPGEGDHKVTFVEGEFGESQNKDWVVLPDIINLNLHLDKVGSNGELIMDEEAVKNCLQIYELTGELVGKPTCPHRANALGY